MVNRLSTNAVEENKNDKAIIDNCVSDEELLIQHVICGESELLYIDTFLMETFGRG